MNIVRVKSTLVALFSVVVLILAGMAAPATATVSSRPAASGTIKLGFFAQLSGQYAAAGIDMLNAARLAVASANKAGGVLGRHITLDPQDSGCKGLVAVQAAQKLVADGVVAVVGPYCSTDAIPASTIYHRAGIAMVTPAATNPKLTGQGFDRGESTFGILDLREDRVRVGDAVRGVGYERGSLDLRLRRALFPLSPVSADAVQEQRGERKDNEGDEALRVHHGRVTALDRSRRGARDGNARGA